MFYASVTVKSKRCKFFPSLVTVTSNRYKLLRLCNGNEVIVTLRSIDAQL